MAVRPEDGSISEAAEARTAFELVSSLFCWPVPLSDVSPDGKTVAIVTTAGDGARTRAIVVPRFSEELKPLVPTER